MKFDWLKLAAASALLLLVVALPAQADTINSYGFSSTLVGVSGGVSGTMTYNLTTNTISGGSFSFSGNSIFAGMTVNIPTMVGSKGQFLFTFSTSILNPTTGQMDSVSFSVLLDPVKGTIILAGGQIYDPKTGQWAGFAADKFQQVPEYGNNLSYLIPSALVLFGSVFVVGRQRRPVRT